MGEPDRAAGGGALEIDDGALVSVTLAEVFDADGTLDVSGGGGFDGAEEYPEVELTIETHGATVRVSLDAEQVRELRADLDEELTTARELVASR